METLESIIHIASHSSFSVFFWNIVCKLIPALIAPEVIRTWLLMEMDRCILPKSAVKSLCGIFMDDDEVMASLRHMASLYEMPPVTNEKPQDKIQSFLDALVVSKSPLKRDEITSQPNVSTKKPRVKAFIENMPERNVYLAESIGVEYVDSCIPISVIVNKGWYLCYESQ